MKKNYIVTGGAGFIGANIVNDLLKTKNNVVHVFDNLSSGNIRNLDLANSSLFFYNIDLKCDPLDWPKINDVDTLFHLSANADVRGGINNRSIDFLENVVVTKSICDYSRLHKIRKIAFASSATVYGEPEVFPTPETCHTLQTSVYGASKLAGESYLQAYSEYGDFSVTIFRFVSWVGEGYSHGVIYDFYKKLMKNKRELEILGDGLQKKSYLDVRDGIRGVIDLTKSNNQKIQIYNLGHNEFITVKELAAIVLKELNLSDVKLLFQGGKRGWIGDSPIVHLDISKAKFLGWEPKIPIKEAIKSTVKYLSEDQSRIYR